MEILAERIRARMHELGKSPHRVAVEASLEKSYIADLLDGSKKSISVNALPGIAAVLECDVAYLVGEQDRARAGGNGLPVGGIIELGTLRAPAPGPERVAIPPDPRFPVSGQAAYLVNDDHGVPFAILRGAYVTVLLDGASPARAGDIVVVRSSTEIDGKVAHETSFREVTAGSGVVSYTLPGGEPQPFDQVVGRVIRATSIW